MTRSRLGARTNETPNGRTIDVWDSQATVIVGERDD
jgi:hypothetical protein